MIKDNLKYISCLFFIALFLFKGSVLLLPSLSVLINQENIEVLINQEAEDTQKNGEEKKEVELKQYYTPHNYDIHFSINGIGLSSKNISANNIHCKENMSLPVLTPPPDIA
ncbi:MAG: hypothetical protein V4556_02530 [Bacteroidota bacterium]